MATHSSIFAWKILNRKVMADLAMNEPKAFEAIVNAVK